MDTNEHQQGRAAQAGTASRGGCIREQPRPCAALPAQEFWIPCGSSPATGGLAAGQSAPLVYRRPPAITSVSPEIHEESGDARKTAAPAMSTGWPSRPSGVW